MREHGHQLRSDLIIIIGSSKDRNLPVLWYLLLRYVASPLLVMILSFAYPDFYRSRHDSLHIVGLTLAHVGIAAILLLFLVPE